MPRLVLNFQPAPWPDVKLEILSLLNLKKQLRQWLSHTLFIYPYCLSMQQNYILKAVFTQTICIELTFG